MASTPSASLLPRYGDGTTSLPGLEHVPRQSPQPSPGFPPSPMSHGSNSSDVNKPLPPSPPPPLFSPHRQRLKGSPQSRSSDTLNHRISTPLPRAPKPHRPLSAASATPTSIIEDYNENELGIQLPRVNTPLPAPRARTSFSPTEQEERLQAFEDLATSSFQTEPYFVEELVHPRVPSRPSITDSATSRPETLPYSFRSTPDMSNLQDPYPLPTWAQDAHRSAEDAAARYRLSLLPSPFDSASSFNGFEDVDTTPNHPMLPPLPKQSPFDLAREQDDILTPTFPTTSYPAFALPFPPPPPARHSYDATHEDTYRASRLFSPAPDSIHPMYVPTPQPSYGTPSVDEQGHDADADDNDDWGQALTESHGSWEDDLDDHHPPSSQHEYTVSPLEEEEIPPRRFSQAPTSRSSRPTLTTYSMIQPPLSRCSKVIQTPQPGPHSRTAPSKIPQLHKAPVPKPLSMIAQNRRSLALRIEAENDRSARTSLGGMSVSAETESMYEDDVLPKEMAYTLPRGDAPESRFSDDSETEGKVRRRSNPLLRLGKAFGQGHRKTPSATSSAVSSPSIASAIMGVSDGSGGGASAGASPFSPKPAVKRPGHKRGQNSITKLGVKFDDQIGGMYDTLQRFSLEGGKMKAKGGEDDKTRNPELSSAATSPKSPAAGSNGGIKRKSKQIIKKLRKREYSGLIRLPGSPRSPRTPKSPRTPASPPIVTKYAYGASWETVGIERDETEEGSEGWLSRRRKQKDEARREKWREDMKGRIKVVHGEPQAMMAIVDNRSALNGGVL